MPLENEAGIVAPGDHGAGDVALDHRPVDLIGIEPDVPASGHFMAYFVTAMVFVVIGYLIYHNKQKVR